MLRIIPHTKKYEDVTENLVYCFYCYMHGQLQNDNNYDVFCFQSKELFDKIGDEIRGGNFPEGEHDCEFEGEPCIFVYWRDQEGGNRGFVVYKNDEIALKDAREKAAIRKRNI